MAKKILFSFSILSFIFLMANQVKAVCPVCTIAVGAGVGLCRYLGIDDLISGTWIGGLIASFIIWTLDWLDKKRVHFLFRKIIVSTFLYLIIIIPLYWLGIMGHPINKFLGIDKLLFGIIAGSFAFVISIWFNNFLKKKNQGRVFFPFQKVVIPILFLVISSLILLQLC